MWFAVTESSLQMADIRKGAFPVAFAGATIFGGHSIPIEAVSTPLAVGAIRVPNAFQALSGDGVTMTLLEGVHIAAAVAGDTGFPRDCRVSIVTVCTSLAPSSRVSRGTLVTDYFVPILKVAGRAEIVGGCGEGAGTPLAVPRSPSGRQPVEAGHTLLTVVPGCVMLTCKANAMNITFSCMAMAITGLTNSSEEYSIHTVIAREAGLTGDPCVALGTFAVFHLGGHGQVYDVRASCIQRDRIQPVKSPFCRIVVGSDQEMRHVGKDSHELVAIYLPFFIKISEVLRHKSDHVQVLFIGL